MSADALARIVGDGPLLVLAPHPDDESLGCGALMAACWRRGVAVHVACLTDGAASHPGSRAWPAARLSARRRAELAEAVRILGGGPGDVTWLGHPDAALHRIDASGRLLADQIVALADRTRARVMLAPSAADPHCDHVAAAGAAARALARRPALRLLSYPIWSRWRAGGEAPRAQGTRRHSFDPGPFAALKARAIAAHASQMGGVVTDDPSGFVMPPGFAGMFAAAPEIFDEPERAAAWA